MSSLSTIDLVRSLPEVYLAAAICLVLLFDLFVAGERVARTATLTLLVLVAGAALTLYGTTPGTRILAYGGLYVADDVSRLLKVAAFLFTALTLFYGNGYLKRRGLMRGEFYVLTLSALLGVLVLASATNLLTVYVGIELLSLSLYGIVAFDRDNGIAAEAGMKYFVLGAIASGMLLYGMSLLYGVTGTLDLAQLSTQLTQSPGVGLIMGITFVVAAVAFKFGATPFHMWVPDVYQGAPVASSMLVATVPKLASFALAFRLLAEGLTQQSAEWSAMLAILAVLSVIAGNIIAIAQANILRMLAYSAIANVGFVLFGFVVASATGYEAALYYTLAYVLMTVAAFGAVLAMSRDGFEATRLDDYKGLSRRDPLLAGIIAVVMFSTAGIPPFVGFWAKLRVILALLDGDQLWIAIVAVLASVIGAYYYLRVVWLMYFDPPGERPGPSQALALRVVLALNALAILLLGIAPGGLLDMVQRAIPGG
ncbi:MAG: NADH-quinone oxidoreductase subunit NuoN [Nevskiaceae bacterium]|jgi:NADH-quinone oxidoreductase subunit N|nr:NADH-quinone oxidoreductase subunit NuoN [Nevskiaceae bacterium]